jgi:leucyl-tRNA synthetase
LERTWNLQDKISAISTPSAKLTTALHQTIKKITEDIEAMRFNTAVAKLMELINIFSEAESLPREYVGIFARLLSPFAPHLCEELWQALGNTGSISTAAWPTYDPNSIANSELTIAIQINGKVRNTITVPADATEETIKTQALSTEKVKGWLEGKEPKKVIYVRGKLVSIVVQ